MIVAIGPLAAALVAAAGGPPPGSAPPPSTAASPGAAPPGVSADDLAKIQKGLAADQAAEARSQPAQPAPSSGIGAAIQSVNPDISAILDVAGALFDHEPMELGGHDPDHTGFTLQQLELHLGAEVDPFFRLDGNIVFLSGGVELEEAYATTLAAPANLQFRAGEFLTRFGRLNPTHPHTWHFVDQPMVLSRFLGEDGSRGVGAEASWLAPLPWYVELVASATNPAGDCCDRSFTFGGASTEPRVVGTLHLSQFFPFGEDWSLLFGLSAQAGSNDSGVSRHTQLYGADAYLRFRPIDSPSRAAVSLQTEALWRSRQIPGSTLRDAGGYAELVWNVDPGWETGARAELTSGVEGDPLDPFWTSSRTRYAVQLTHYPSHFSRLRLQLAADDPTFRDRRPILAAFLALEVVIGAHGAHAY